MTGAFEQGHDLHLAERLTRALIAALDAGGEEGPTHSAALIVAHERPGHWWICVMTGLMIALPGRFSIYGKTMNHR